MAILRVLSCDNCGRLGARAVVGGSEARKADNAGSIRRARLLRYIRVGSARVTPESIDLCATCRDPQTVGVLRARRAATLADYGYEVID